MASSQYFSMKSEIKRLIALITELGDALNEDKQVYAALSTIAENLERRKGIKDTRELLDENKRLRDEFIAMAKEDWIAGDAATVEKSKKAHEKNGEDIIDTMIESGEYLSMDQLNAFKKVLIAERDEVEAEIDKLKRTKKRKTEKG